MTINLTNLCLRSINVTLNQRKSFMFFLSNREMK